MPRWRVFYADGISLSDVDSTPDDLPALDVQVVAVAHPTVGVRLWTAKDYYWYEGDTWVGGDTFGLWDYLARPGWKRVLFGRTISDADYEAVCRVAWGETADPVKHGWLPAEHVTGLT